MSSTNPKTSLKLSEHEINYIYNRIENGYLKHSLLVEEKQDKKIKILREVMTKLANADISLIKHTLHGCDEITTVKDVTLQWLDSAYPSLMEVLALVRAEIFCIDGRKTTLDIEDVTTKVVYGPRGDFVPQAGDDMHRFAGWVGNDYDDLYFTGCTLVFRVI